MDHFIPLTTGTCMHFLHHLLEDQIFGSKAYCFNLPNITNIHTECFCCLFKLERHHSTPPFKFTIYHVTGPPESRIKGERFSKYSQFLSLILRSNFTHLKSLKCRYNCSRAQVLQPHSKDSHWELVSDLDSFANLQFWSSGRVVWPSYSKPAVPLCIASFSSPSPPSSTGFTFLGFVHAASNFSSTRCLPTHLPSPPLALPCPYVVRCLLLIEGQL